MGSYTGDFLTIPEMSGSPYIREWGQNRAQNRSASWLLVQTPS